MLPESILASLQSTNLYLSGATNNTAFFHDLLQTAIASSNYNAAQVKVTERLGGFSLLGSYTFAHSLDDGSDPLAPGAGASGLPRDSFNLKAEYGNSPFDVRQRGTAAIVYALPIGHGERFLSNGLFGRIFEGIQLSGIQQVQTGLPFDLRGTRDNLHTGLTNRPQLVGKAYPSGRERLSPVARSLRPSANAFANAPFDVPASIGRNTYYGPGFVNTDVVFQKSQSLIEGVKVVFRGRKL